MPMMPFAMPHQYITSGLNHAAEFMMVGNSSGKQLRSKRCAPSV